MEVAFVRIPERESEAAVSLDGRVLIVRSPGNLKIVPPHDLGQFIVEHELRWQTGFWGYVARGVIFPGMDQRSGRRPPHGEERSRAAISGAKDDLAEVESLAGAVAAIVRDDLDRNPDRVRAPVRDDVVAAGTRQRDSLEDIQRACAAFRQVCRADCPAPAGGRERQSR